MRLGAHRHKVVAATQVALWHRQGVMPDVTHIDSLLTRHHLISDQVDRRELRIILSELDRRLQNDPAGVVVEFGCYIGTTSLFIRRLLDMHPSTHDFHVYDSFEGLPEKSDFDASPAGTQFVAGELDASRKEFVMQFKKAGLMTPKIHKGWFSELASSAIPSNIMFAYLDGDYYESIRDSLNLVTPHLSDEWTIVVDDYANEALPGAARAVNEWLENMRANLRIEASLAIIHSKTS